MTQTGEANQDQREYWTGEGAEFWHLCGDWWGEMFAPFGQAMFDAADLQPGERVLDVGCGFGTTTVEAAERVAPHGAAVGIDVAPQLLETARKRAAGIGNISWLQGDAQVHPFEPASYDVVISRFAAMLFDDPPTAFANLHRALRPGGRLSFVCWQDPTKVEWIAVAIAAAVPVVGRPPDLGEPGAPGPFAFGDGERARKLVSAGGFSDV
ncbi:MAG: class I SAM-dependent methyltransferase, partial [Actinomycetota bacterium]